MKYTRSLALVALTTAVAASCGPAENTNRRLVRRRVEGLQTAQSREDRSRCDATQPGRNSSEYDTNSDGVPDVRKVYQQTGEGSAMRSVLICREVDLNYDGTKDLFRFYNEQGRTVREEEDRDFDGRIDVVTYFEGGEVVRREMDTNGDGQVDMRVYYRDRRPYRAEREVNNDRDPEFHADYWEFYDSRGHVQRIGWDYNNDGRADRWDRIDRVAPLRAAQAASDGDAGAAAQGDGGAAVPAAAGDAGAAASGDGGASR